MKTNTITKTKDLSNRIKASAIVLWVGAIKPKKHLKTVPGLILFIWRGLWT